MIVRLTGTLIEISEESVVLERDGVAREVLVPRFSIPELAAHRGKVVTFHTLEYYEGSMTSGGLIPRVVGFLHLEDKVFYTRFTSVKGIGTRKALKALTEPVRRIASWIEAGDGKALSRLPGIGPRAGELVIASLKGKLKDLAIPDAADESCEAVELSDGQRDALEVLIAWGDPRSDVERWLGRAAQLHPDLNSPDEWVRVAYRIKSGAEG